jgi:hypothetical protein
MSPGEVHVNRPFQDLGIDSLMAVAARDLWWLLEVSGTARALSHSGGQKQ